MTDGETEYLLLLAEFERTEIEERRKKLARAIAEFRKKQSRTEGRVDLNPVSTTSQEDITDYYLDPLTQVIHMSLVSRDILHQALFIRLGVVFLIIKPAQVSGGISMKIQDVAFCVTDWSKLEPVEHRGTTGAAYWRTLEVGNIRVRMVEYTPGYLADHWCKRGHVLLVLEGELITELEDGRKFTLTPGQSYQVADGAEAHRSQTERGAKLFIVD